MSGIDIFAWFVLFVILGSVVYVFVLLGKWPGAVAEERNHEKQDAIKVGSWVTIIALQPLWPVVLMWAYCAPKPPKEVLTADDIDDKIKKLEKQIKKLEKEKDELEDEE